MSSKFTCIHIGARAHYLIPASLSKKNKLSWLITDTWIGNDAIRKLILKFPLRLVRSYGNRYNKTISSDFVSSFNIRFFFVELLLRLKRKNGWDLILARNFWFQKFALQAYKGLPKNNDAVLGISYTALAVFKLAKKENKKTILFQIDPGLFEEDIVRKITDEVAATYPTSWEQAPPHYWDEWRQECELSDVIMVNSEWSKKGLVEKGISSSKIIVVPLPFDLRELHRTFKKNYPQKFDISRPLKCLFLGTLTFRKGLHLVLDVAKRLKEYPIEFILVGNSEADISKLNLPNLIYKGVASRAETDQYYQDCDVFLFPTLSDGFGLTQLESLAWQLPVIGTRCSGEVIDDGLDGIILPEVTVASLENAILQCYNNAPMLRELSSNALKKVEKYSLEVFAEQLASL